MKKYTFIFLLLAFASCAPAGTTDRQLQGDERDLPNELKGMKVYKVWVEDGNYVRVAVLNNQVNSLTYNNGKGAPHTTIMVNNNAGGKVIEVKEIISENDSIIVCKK